MSEGFPFGGDGPSAPWRQTAHEYARETLRRAILSGSLKGGSRLVQADIAAKLRVSTTPVREALRQLAADGLVVFDPHVGAIVRRRDQSELIEIYDILAALSPLAMERASRLIEQNQLDEARALFERMKEQHDIPEWAKLNIEFHAIIEGASQAPTLAAMLKNMHDAAAIHVIRSLQADPSRMTSGNREHAEMLDALEHGDGKRASAVMLKHVNATLQLVLATFADEDERDLELAD